MRRFAALRARVPGDADHGCFNGVSVATALNVPLERRAGAGGGQGRLGDRSAGGSPTLSATVTAVPYASWFASLTAFRYLDPGRQQPWNPDFTYCFGYSDWRPNTFSLSYCNYGGNRFSGWRSDFATGGWSAAWRFDLPDWLARPMLIDTGRTISCSAAYGFSIRSENGRTQAREGWKDKLQLGCNYPVWGGFAANWAVHHYLRDGQQQDWDPDYTYGFGYSGSAPLGSWGLNYANYSGNRFDHDRRATGTGRFLNGQVSASWRFSF